MDMSKVPHECAELKPLLRRIKRSNTRVCMLIITHACNLNCTYCYESHKGYSRMSFESAKKIILGEVELVRKSNVFERLEVDFMGGEPFMNYTLIKQIVEWIECLDVGFPIGTFCSTNGTLVTAEKYDWLYKHRMSFTCGLSYDGNEIMQEINRTHLGVDVRFFLETWPKQWIRITISKETLPFLVEGVLHLQKQGANVQMALAQGIDWDATDVELFSRELDRLSNIYLNDSRIEPIEFLTKPLFNIGNRGEEPVKLCGAGNGMVTYDVDGRCYPCHMFTPLVLGNKALQLKDVTFCQDRKSIDPKCKQCIYMNWCSLCYGFNFLYRHDPLSRDDHICKMTDVHARACCEFQLKYYHQNKKRLNALDGEQIRAALDTYAILSQHVTDWKECWQTVKDGKEVK